MGACGRASTSGTASIRGRPCPATKVLEWTESSTRGTSGRWGTRTLTSIEGSEQDTARGGGQLMDEATVRRMMAAERKQHEARLHTDTKDSKESKDSRKGETQLQRQSRAKPKSKQAKEEEKPDEK